MKSTGKCVLGSTLSRSIFLGIMGDDGLSKPFPWPVTSRTTCNDTKTSTHQRFTTHVNIFHHTGGPYKNLCPLVQYYFWQSDIIIMWRYNKYVCSPWKNEERTVVTWSHFSACSLLCTASTNTSPPGREKRSSCFFLRPSLGT